MGTFLSEVRPTRRTIDLDDETNIDDVPWNAFDARSSYEPFGNLHLGIQFRGAAAFGPSGEYPLLELGAFFDFRLDADRERVIRYTVDYERPEVLPQSIELPRGRNR